MRELAEFKQPFYVLICSDFYPWYDRVPCCRQEPYQRSKSALRLTESVRTKLWDVPHCLSSSFFWNLTEDCSDCSQLTNMLLRTAALFLLCVSTGMCATLGYFQTEALEDGEVAAVVAQDVPLDYAFDDKIFGSDNSRVDLPEVQDKEPETDKDKPDGNSATMEGFAKKAVTQDQPPPEEEVNEIRPVQTNKASNKPLAQEEASSWSLNSIRDSFQTVHGYFDSLVELVGGHNGVCQYRCRYGKDQSCTFTTF